MVAKKRRAKVPAHWVAPRIIRRLVRGRHTIYTIAERAGLSPQWVSRALRGERMPTIRNAARLAKALGVSMDRLYRVVVPREDAA